MLMLIICISWIFAHSVFMQVSQGAPGSYLEDGVFSLSISVVPKLVDGNHLVAGSSWALDF